MILGFIYLSTMSDITVGIQSAFSSISDIFSVLSSYWITMDSVILADSVFLISGIYDNFIE